MSEYTAVPNLVAEPTSSCKAIQDFSPFSSSYMQATRDNIAFKNVLEALCYMDKINLCVEVTQKTLT